MESTVVPSVVGLPATTAEALLRGAGFRMVPSAPLGTQMSIRSQAPPAGVPMAAGSPVSVVLAG